MLAYLIYFLDLTNLVGQFIMLSVDAAPTLAHGEVGMLDLGWIPPAQ